jgi:putative transposase
MAGETPAVPWWMNMSEPSEIPDGVRALDPHAPIQKTGHRLPHWEQEEVACYLTFRLADSIPAVQLARWHHEKDVWTRMHPQPWKEEVERAFHARFSEQIHAWLDEGMGACVLRDPVAARMIGDALHFFDGERYTLYDYVVMPNHVHVLFQAHGDTTLKSLLHSWRSFTAHAINKALRRRGKLWQDDYFDRLVRSEANFRKIRDYIEQNPVKAHLPARTYLYWTSRRASSGL